MEYGAIINAAWDKLIRNIEDPVEKEKILKPILDWGVTNPGKDKRHSTKAIVKNMRHATEQFTGLVSLSPLPSPTGVNVLFSGRGVSQYRGDRSVRGHHLPRDRSRRQTKIYAVRRIEHPQELAHRFEHRYSAGY
jgi:hypothetical protein